MNITNSAMPFLSPWLFMVVSLSTYLIPALPAPSLSPTLFLHIWIKPNSPLHWTNILTIVACSPRVHSQTHVDTNHSFCVHLSIQ